MWDWGNDEVMAHAAEQFTQEFDIRELVASQMTAIELIHYHLHDGGRLSFHSIGFLSFKTCLAIDNDTVNRGCSPPHYHTAYQHPHPHIVAIHGIFRGPTVHPEELEVSLGNGTTNYVLMDICTKNLDEHVRALEAKGETMSEHDILILLCQLLEALAHLHARMFSPFNCCITAC